MNLIQGQTCFLNIYCMSSEWWRGKWKQKWQTLAAPWVVQETACAALGNFWSSENLQDPHTWNKWTTKWTSMYNSVERQLDQNPIDLSYNLGSALCIWANDLPSLSPSFQAHKKNGNTIPYCYLTHRWEVYMDSIIRFSVTQRSSNYICYRNSERKKDILCGLEYSEQFCTGQETGVKCGI